MTVSTISTSIRNFITLGSGSYAAQLTVTSTGTVNPGNFLPRDSTSSYPSVTVDTAGSRLVNAGLIAGGSVPALNNTSYPGGQNGVVLSNGYVENSGVITSGNGRVDRSAVLETGGTLRNAGTIIGSSSGAAVGLTLQAGKVSNTGTIAGGAGAAGLSMSGGTLVNDGLIAAGPVEYVNEISTWIGHGTDLTGGTLINNGVIISTAPSGLYVGVHMLGGTVINAGTISQITGALTNAATPAQSPQIVNTGTVQEGISLSTGGGIVDAGVIGGDPYLSGTAIKFGKGNASLLLEPGASILGGVTAVGSYIKTIYASSGGGPIFPTIVTITDVNTIELAPGSAAGSIDIGESFINFNTISFDPGATWVLGGGAAELAAGQRITGFDLGDTLVVDGFSASSYAFSGGELTLTHGAQNLTINLEGSFSGLLVTDVAQGTEIAVCYLRGTSIFTPQGERAIEDLRPGDAVVTKFGGVRRIKWIGTQSYAARFLEGNDDMLPVRIKANALGQGLPARDLFVSPGHSLLLDGQLVLAKFLVNGITVTQGAAPAQIDYFNIELDTHDCLMAAGVWAETYAECTVTRGMFHNAADFAARFPGHIAPGTPRLCAPRPMTGVALAAAITPAVARAEALAPPGPLRGYIDILTPDGCIEGWAQDAANPELPVWLDILRDGEVAARVLACEMRQDLRDAGLGSGRHAFRLKIAAGTGMVEVRRAGSGAKLALTDSARAA